MGFRSDEIEIDFALIEAKNAGIAELSRGFLTKSSAKSANF